jgi:hypothetical protein
MYDWAQRVRWQAGLRCAGQQPAYGRRDTGEALGLKERPDEWAAPDRGIDGVDGGGIEHVRIVGAATWEYNRAILMRLINCVRHDTSAADKQVVSSGSP